MGEDSCKNRPPIPLLPASSSLWHPGPRLLYSNRCLVLRTWAASLWPLPPPTGPRLRWSMPSHGNWSFCCVGRHACWPFIIMILMSLGLNSQCLGFVRVQNWVVKAMTFSCILVIMWNLDWNCGVWSEGERKKKVYPNFVGRKLKTGKGYIDYGVFKNRIKVLFFKN